MDLAAKAQVSRDWVSKAENGRNISIQVLYQLSAALGLSPEDLLQRSAKKVLTAKYINLLTGPRARKHYVCNKSELVIELLPEATPVL
jgi:transcriptional regulator with XRE-family HTH domain